MAASVNTERSSPIESFSLECSRKPTSVALGMGGAPTRQIPALDGVKMEPFIIRCWKVVTDVASAIWRVVCGIITQVWERSFCRMKGSDITLGERLLAFMDLLDLCKEGASAADAARLKTAYDELPRIVRKELNTEIPGNKKWISKERETLDIVHMNQCCDVADIVESIYDDLPSVQLDFLKDQLAEKITDAEKLGILCKMIHLVTSEIEPNITEEVLDAYMLAVFDELEGSLKEKIYKRISSPEFKQEKKGLINLQGTDHLSIKGVMISVKDADFASLVLRSMPRSSRVAAAILRETMASVPVNSTSI